METLNAALVSLMLLLATTQGEVPVDSRPVILALGDSLTAGYGVPAGSGYPEQLQKRLDSAGYKYRVVNMGISGDTSSGGRNRMTRALALNPAVVILELGGNDRANGLTPAQTETNLDQMIKLFTNGGITVVLASRAPGGQRQVFEALTEKHRLLWISSFLEGVAGNPELTIGDGAHPNREGYSIVTETVMKAIAPLLKK